ncbi:multidrug ABC transporter substrate-binding protein [Bradyrhizobium centrolobii]|uniref:Multidrug ABC transporter substrate-binding protein n=1 Tax=Bradyrhizobium centrolobii TaxID=1505087 RepID=A0A176YA53_9BRAD|nr:ABC transporter permease [Bradyrhizobium centrolobii]OAE99034.1 multidrug ABC transporter substrate-binding protein [Bradyrhizobium centrolobii]
MSRLESLRIATRALRINKLRSALTVLGIIVGVGAVVCMVSVGAGAQAEVSEKIRTLGANLLLVMPGARNSGGARLESGTQPTLTEEDAASIRRELVDVQVAAPLLSRSIPLVAANKNWVTVVAGINADYLVAREWQVASGRSFTSDEIVSGAKVAIVGSVIVEELFNGHAGPGETLRIGNVPFTVIGVLGKKGVGAAGRSQDDVVFIPLSAAKSRVLGAVRGTTREALDFISIKVSDATAMPEIERQIETLLRQRHRIRADAPSDFKIENPAEILFARGAAVRLLGSLLIAVAAVSLVVGGISIMNIMLVSVTERTREIGLRMAVGASRRDIRWQFLIEALILALMGGLVGAVLGAAAAIAIAWKAGWPILISPWAIVLACGFAGFIGISFGLYPAHRAARLDPIVALRFE